MGSISRWRSILLTLGDTAFFDILRNYLGEIKTPFNKHELIGRLESFLLNAENQRLILSLIDENDVDLLEAIDVLDDPTHDMLFAFLRSSYPREKVSYVDIHHRLLNLEDRLLIYRDPEEKTINVNPLLAPALRSIVLRRERAFPAFQIGGDETGNIIDELPWLTDSLVLAFFSYLMSTPEIFRTGGSLRKKSEEELVRIFPQLMAHTVGTSRRFDVLVGALTSLGMVARLDTSLVPVPPHLSKIAAMERRERHELYWLAAMFRDQDHAYAHLHFIRALEQCLPANFGYGPRVMEKLCAAIYLRVMRHEPPPSFVHDAPAFGSLITSGEDEAPAEETTGLTRHEDMRVLVAGLRRLGFLCETDNGDLVRNPHLQTVFEDENDEPALIVQPTFAITMKPWLSLSSGLPIASSAEIRQFDLYPQYELTKSSFGRGLAQGYDAVELQFTLEALSSTPLPQNVAFSLSNWSSEYSSIALYEGVVLVADERRRFLVEHSEQLRRFIRRTLAPGVYLFDPRERLQWEEALKAEGVDMLPHPHVMNDIHLGSGSTSVANAAVGARLPGQKLPLLPRNLELFSPENEPQDEEGACGPVERSEELPDPAEVERNLFAALDALQISRDKREEIAERIRRRLIVHPAQISPHITRGERIEAKGLDYTGKIRLIEQVLKDQREVDRGAYLEVIRRTAKGAPSRTLIRPTELIRSGSQLILRGNTIPDEHEVAIPVSKMVLVRKVKGTLFG